MSFGKGVRRRGRVAAALTTVGALAAFQALAIVGAVGASAVTGCTYNPATDTINITIDPGQSAGLMVEDTPGQDANAPAGAILFDNNGAGFGLNTACGSASNTNTVAIVVLGSPGSAEQFTIDENTGGTFNTAIAWNIDLGTGTDFLRFDLADDQDNALVATDSSFTLNGGAAGEVLGAELWQAFGGNQDDTIDGTGMVNSLLFDVGGNNGDDFIATGPQEKLPPVFGLEFLSGGGGIDTLSYATRTTSIFVLNGVTAGNDANADGDNSDPGDESDTLIGCFEIVETGSGNDEIDDGACGPSAYAPGDGDDDVIGDAGDTIDWSTSSAGMTITPETGDATGQGADEWVGPTNFVGSPLDDTLIWDDPTTNTFVGGAGIDTVDASAETSGQSINLDTLDDGVAPLGPDVTVDSLENAIGGAGNDTLLGNDIANNLQGGLGDDILRGAAGDDTLIGAAGNNAYNGGSGRDTVSFADAPAGPNGKVGVVVDLSLFFATHNDGSDTFEDVPETVIGSAFNDQITGGPNLAGGTVNYTFKGTAGNDTLTGFSGNDTLNGAGGRDTVRGSAGDDTLKGGAQNDTLSGGGGFDIGKGGNGKDVCSSVEQRSSCGTKKHPAAPQTAAAGRLD